MLNNIVALLGNGAGGGATSFESIATVTASGGETSLTFSSIPSTFKHLQIRCVSRDTYTGAGLDVGFYIRINGDASNAYSIHGLYGAGTSAVAYGAANYTGGALGVSAGGSLTANVFGANIINILDYNSTTKNKTVSLFGGIEANGSGIVSLLSGMRINTTAVTSITLAAGTTAFAAGSTFALYGIL